MREGREGGREGGPTEGGRWEEGRERRESLWSKSLNHSN